VPRPALFERGLQNVQAMGAAEWGSLPLPPRLRLDVLVCEHFYTTTHALLLDRSLPRQGRHGNLLVVPHRGVLAAFPVDGPDTLHAMEGMLVLAAGLFREGPGSISPHVYWRTPGGRFELQQSVTEGRRVRFSPSPGFAQVLAHLGGDA
jgi:hypothetical protein